jgi:hypothetical protein
MFDHSTWLLLASLCVVVGMSFSNYTSQALLNSLFKKTSNFGALATAPTIYVGLSSTTPAEDGTGVTEPSGGAYARVATAAADWNAATAANPSVVTNANAVTFPAATTDWLAAANLTHFVAYDAASGGNMLFNGALTVAKPVLLGDTPSFAAGTLQTTLT